MGGVERGEHVAERARLEAHLRGATGQLAELGGDADGDGHRFSSWPCGFVGLAHDSRSAGSNAAWNASRFGAMVAVGPTWSTTASSVLSPWPVM